MTKIEKQNEKEIPKDEVSEEAKKVPSFADLLVSSRKNHERMLKENNNK